MGTSSHDEKYLEFKVGAMILIALAILVFFVLVLSDFSFFKNYKELNVYFQNPGGLSAGAAAKVAGRKVGSISEMTFLGQNGPKHPISQKPVLVKIKVKIEEEMFNFCKDDINVYITTKGVLGDPFLEIDPGFDAKPLDISKPIFGTDPPRLDIFLADAADLVKSLNRLLSTNAQNIDKLLTGSANLVSSIDSLFQRDGGISEETARIGLIIDNVENLIGEVRTLVGGAQETYIDNPDIEQAISNLNSLSGKLNKEIGPLIADVKHALEIVNRLGDTIGLEEQKAIKNALLKLDNIAVRTESTLIKVDTMIAKVKRGEGSIGQFLTDEEIYDDLKELLRDIKHHPWKLIWEN